MTSLKDNILAGAELMSDKGYQIGTEEGYLAFAKKRQKSIDRMNACRSLEAQDATVGQANPRESGSFSGVAPRKDE